MREPRRPLWRDARAVSSVMVGVIMSGALFIGSAGVLLAVSQEQAEELPNDATDAATLHSRSRGLADVLIRSPGFASGGQDWIASPALVDQLDRIGLTTAGSAMLDFNKFENLRDAPFDADSGDGFLNYVEARAALDLDVEELDFHIRGMPSLKSVEERLREGYRDEFLRVGYVGDYYRSYQGNGNGGGNGGNNNGGQAPDAGLVVQGFSCGPSPDSTKVMRIGVDILNGGSSATQFLAVLDLDFSTTNNNLDPRRQGVSFQVNAGATTTIPIDVPAAHGWRCTNIDSLQLEIHDPAIMLQEGAPTDPAFASDDGLAGTGQDLRFAGTHSWWRVSDDVVFDYGEVEKNENLRLSVYAGQADPPSGAPVFVDAFQAPKKQDQFYTIPQGTLGIGDHVAFLEHVASGVNVSTRLHIVPPAPAAPPVYTAPGQSAADYQYLPGEAVAPEVGYVEVLVNQFCPYRFDSKSVSPLPGAEPYAQRCQTVKTTGNPAAGGLAQPTNHPPLARAEVTCSALTCDFDGAASTDEDGSITAYEWDFDDDGTVDATGEAVQYTYSSAYQANIGLRVVDDDGASSTDLEFIIVHATTAEDASEPPGTQCAPPEACNPVPAAVASVFCDSLACTLDAWTSGDDGSMSYAWDLDDDGVFDDATGVSISHTFAADGTYPIALRATDNDGATSVDKEQVTVEIGTTSSVVGERTGDVYPDTRDVLQAALAPQLRGPGGVASLDTYNVLIIGSQVDHQPMVHIKDEISDWVAAGGYLIVFGSEDTNTQWMESIFHIGIHSSSHGVYFPDEQHPLLHVTEELDYHRFENAGDTWHFTAQAQNYFTTVAAADEDNMVLGVSNAGSFGEGHMAVTSWFTHDLLRDGAGTADTEGLKFTNNLLMLGYRTLFLDYGPPIPQGHPVVPAVARAPIVHPQIGLVTMTMIVYVFPGVPAVD